MSRVSRVSMFTKVWRQVQSYKMPSGKKGIKNEKLPRSAPKEESAVGLNPKTNAVIVKVLAKPGAKSNGITDISPEGVGVQIAAPPMDGEANTELVRYMAKVLGVRKSDVNLERGSKSRNKTLEVTGDMTVEGVLASLQKEIGNG